MDNLGFTCPPDDVDPEFRPSVRSPAPAGPSQLCIERRATDLVVEATLEYWLEAIPGLRAAGLEVHAENGVLRLTGIVDNEQLYDRLHRLAWSNEDVTDVIFDIQVSEESPNSGSLGSPLAEHVASALRVSLALELSRVRIQVCEGAVVLSGATQSLAVKLLAERVALESARIHRIVNKLLVFGELPN